MSIDGWIDQSRATGRDMRLGQMCFACDASLRPATSRRVWPETDDSDLAKLGSVRHRPAVARACAPADRRRPSICRFRGAVAVPVRCRKEKRRALISMVFGMAELATGVSDHMALHSLVSS